MVAALDFPATHRNKHAITEVLISRLPIGDVIEVAAGSGQHVAHFSSVFPDNVFWPTDLNPEHVNSIDAWVQKTGATNVQKATLLDITGEDWRTGEPIAGLPEKASALFCANMIHIAPIAAMHGLFEGAGKRIRSGGKLFLYGPFLGMAQDAPSNKEFDASLKSRNSEWGVRHMVEVRMAAKLSGFDLAKTNPLPANNFLLAFRRT